MEPVIAAAFAIASRHLADQMLVGSGLRSDLAALHPDRLGPIDVRSVDSWGAPAVLAEHDVASDVRDHFLARLQDPRVLLMVATVPVPRAVAA